MDLSKLPKLSNTPPPPPQPAETAPAAPAAPASAFCGACGKPVNPGARFCDGCGKPLSAGGELTAPVVEAVLCLIAGLFLLFLAPRFLQWLLHVTFGAQWTWTFTDVDGSPITYPQSTFFWADLGPFAFSAVLILNAIVLLALRRRTVLMLMCGLTAAVAVYNLVYLVMTFSSAGFAPVSFLAAAFGGLMTAYLWRLIGYVPRT